MRRLIVAFVLLLALVPMGTATPAAAQSVSCSSFDAWEWAQTIYDSDPSTHSSLDPDGNGIVCDQLPHGGFAPTTWADKVPTGLQEATILRVIDGDTFEMSIDGVSNRVRIYRADTPETQNKQECGGQQATDFATWALGFNDLGNTVYLERDKNTRDIYGRELAYVWFTVGGQPYMLNELLIRSGWADDADFGDRKYAEQFGAAKDFAKDHDLGVWAQCGGFGVPVSGTSSSGGSGTGNAPADQQPSTGNEGGSADQPANEPVYVAPTEAPVYEAPVEEPDQGGGCNPNYTGCVPNVPYDLDCKDIGYSVQVIGYDQYNLDGDGDGWGCESY